MIPDNKPFTIQCPVEQTDRFQKDFIEVYDEAQRVRRTAKRNMILIPAIAAAAAVACLLIPSVYVGYAAVAMVLGLVYGGYYVYLYCRGYQKEIIQLQKLLDRAVKAGKTVYEPLDMTYEFGLDRVEIIYNGEGATRYFEYEDIAAIDETDRMYIVGIRRNERKLNLEGLDYILITKRALREEQTQVLNQTFQNIAARFGVPLFAGNHPFR